MILRLKKSKKNITWVNGSQTWWTVAQNWPKCCTGELGHELCPGSQNLLINSKFCQKKIVALGTAFIFIWWQDKSVLGTQQLFILLITMVLYWYNEEWGIIILIQKCHFWMQNGTKSLSNISFSTTAKKLYQELSSHTIYW